MHETLWRHTAYNSIARKADANGGAILAGCLAHLRRKFYDLHVSQALAKVTNWGRLAE